MFYLFLRLAYDMFTIYRALSKPENFLKYIGLCDEAPESDEAAVKSQFVQNRLDVSAHK